MSSVADNRLPAFWNSLGEVIEDQEANDVVEQCVNRYFGNNFSRLINDRNFVFNFFSRFICESLDKVRVKVQDNEETDQLILNESRLSQRSKLMVKFVYNYREYQLNFLLILCEIKINLGLSDDLFDAIIKTFHSTGVVSDDAFNHWFQCKSGFEQRRKIIQCCSYLLQMSQEAREDFFYLSS